MSKPLAYFVCDGRRWPMFAPVFYQRTADLDENGCPHPLTVSFFSPPGLPKGSVGYVEVADSPPPQGAFLPLLAVTWVAPAIRPNASMHTATNNPADLEKAELPYPGYTRIPDDN